MNGESVVLKTETLIFPLEPHEEDVSEVKSTQIVETEVSEIQIIETETRFARLKRSLRKRGASIL